MAGQYQAGQQLFPGVPEGVGEGRVHPAEVTVQPGDAEHLNGMLEEPLPLLQASVVLLQLSRQAVFAIQQIFPLLLKGCKFAFKALQPVGFLAERGENGAL